MIADQEVATRRGRLVAASIAVAVLAVALVVGLWVETSGGAGMVAGIRDFQAAITEWGGRNPLLAAAAFFLVVAAGKATPVPGSIVLMLTGGLLFGTVLGGVLAAAGAAACASGIFLLGRRFFMTSVRRRMGRRFSEFEREISGGAFRYLLALRLLPVVPAWLVNLAPVPFPVPVWTVALATFLGVLPVSLIVANLGSGLAEVSDGAAELSAAVVLSPQVLVPLLMLSFLSLASVAAGRRRARRQAMSASARSRTLRSTVCDQSGTGRVPD